MSEESICPVCRLDGIIPSRAAEPRTSAEVAELLHQAMKENTTVAVAGGQSKFSKGAPLTSAACLLSTRQLVKEPLIQVDDLVISVQAGILMDRIQKQLMDDGLYLPVDTRRPGATVGGTIAWGENAELRDALLGIKVVLLDGKIYNFGGQTVKNVAGYDVGKLFIGSKGTLGVITEAWLRVYPLPKASKVLWVDAKETDSLWQAVTETKKTLPAFMEIYDMEHAGKVLGDVGKSDGYILLLKYTGQKLAVEKQCQEAFEILKRCGVSIWGEMSGEDERLFWENRQQRLSEETFQDSVGLKIKVPPANLRNLFQSAQGICRDDGVPAASLYRPIKGEAEFTMQVAAAPNTVNALGDAVRQNKGRLSIETGPVSFRHQYCNETLSPWDLKIKQFFDPKNILNPGKMP